MNISPHFKTFLCAIFKNTKFLFFYEKGVVDSWKSLNKPLLLIPHYQGILYFLSFPQLEVKWVEFVLDATFSCVLISEKHEHLCGHTGTVSFHGVYSFGIILLITEGYAVYCKS